jgi:murein DD-endopeptidase MepM/ murein hydrolase activator NlpD
MLKKQELTKMQKRLFIFLSLFTASAFSFDIKSDWQQGAVIIGRASSDEKIYFQDKLLSVSSQGYFVLGLLRDAAPTAALTVIKQGKSKQHIFNVKAREYNIQRVDGVPQETVEPSPEQLERSKKESALVAAARIDDLPLDFFAQKFQWPLIGPISGVYGSQRIYNGEPKNPHYGVDIAKPTGTLVRAPAGGLVTLVHTNMFFSGGTLILDHGHGLSSTFIHLSKILVKKGDVISQGQDIALVGQTGRASGPHLHWAMNWFQTRVDPQLLVGAMPE